MARLQDAPARADLAGRRRCRAGRARRRARSGPGPRARRCREPRPAASANDSPCNWPAVSPIDLERRRRTGCHLRVHRACVLFDGRGRQPGRPPRRACARRSLSSPPSRGTIVATAAPSRRIVARSHDAITSLSRWVMNSTERPRSRRRAHDGEDALGEVGRQCGRDLVEQQELPDRGRVRAQGRSCGAAAAARHAPSSEKSTCEVERMELAFDAPQPRHRSAAGSARSSGPGRVPDPGTPARDRSVPPAQATRSGPWCR